MNLRAYSVLAVLATVAAHSFGAILVYGGDFSGLNESPPNASPATGTARVTIDDVANTMRVQIDFSGLTAGNTASHIHARPDSSTANGGVASTTPTFTGFPTGATSGSYDHTFDMTLTSSFNASFVTANGGTAASAWAALRAKMADGLTYANIHTSTYPGGEIRANLELVPEPASLAVLALGALALISRRRQGR